MLRPAGSGLLRPLRSEGHRPEGLSLSMQADSVAGAWPGRLPDLGRLTFNEHLGVSSDGLNRPQFATACSTSPSPRL